ncbi:hypothetical protein [Pedobacter glucosidilyticus]|uniref:hypothetical protein n=1 Tax=Pedobacter glucosidilyticus TaxID=1122941 RepID=UPI000422D6C9|nr:hypothetical protein [Pedobacter glucosidilyticus]
MKLNLKSTLLGAITLFMATTACNQANNKADAEHQDSVQNSSLSIEALQENNDFPDAQLTIKNVSTQPAGTDSVKVIFNFDVKNYELTKQTANMPAEHCANSAEGQHIHFILDNQPYQALYKPTNTITLAKNTEHILLNFLSRSYHLSVKSAGASVLTKFKIDENGKYVALPAPKEPMLFYSRPKGDYKGKDTENVLLDFFVSNAKISPNDYKVKVGVADTSFIVDNWTPYFIKGAPAGDLKIRIELVDKNGKTVSNAFNPTERTVAIQP